jgi:hypothetical protein
MEPDLTPIEPRRERGARVAVQAVLDRGARRVDIGGQVLDERGGAVVGADVVVRSSWGVECTTVSTALGSFGARISAPEETSGLAITVEANGVSHRVRVL